MFSLIVATTESGVIGRDGGLIWRIPTDLKHFKEKTMGKKMIMGRKTFESLGKPLPGREHIVLTKNKNYEVEDGITLLHDFSEVKKYKDLEEEVFIIGGEKVFDHFLIDCDTLYITFIKKELEGDTHFPLEKLKDFKEVHREELVDKKSKIPIAFTVFKRKNKIR